MKRRIIKFKGKGEAEGCSLNIPADNLILARIKVKKMGFNPDDYDFSGVVEIEEVEK